MTKRRNEEDHDGFDGLTPPDEEPGTRNEEPDKKLVETDIPEDLTMAEGTEEPKALAAREINEYAIYGTVSRNMRQLVKKADQELQSWIDDLGGDDGLSSLERSILEDSARAGIILRAQLIRHIQSDGKNMSAARTALSAASTRKMGLHALGLERRQKLITLADVVREIEAKPETPIEDAEIVEEEEGE